LRREGRRSQHSGRAFDDAEIALGPIAQRTQRLFSIEGHLDFWASATIRYGVMKIIFVNKQKP
jgi:hypothetical protein